MKDVSVMIIVDAPAKPNSSQADYPVRRDASEVLCVEKTRTRHETITWSIPCKTIIVNIDFLFLKLSGEDELTGMPSASGAERLQGF